MLYIGNDLNDRAVLGIKALFTHKPKTTQTKLPLSNLYFKSVTAEKHIYMQNVHYTDSLHSADLSNDSLSLPVTLTFSHNFFLSPTPLIICIFHHLSEIEK